MRIAIVVSHPIQHFCPMYASWAKNNDITLKVFFASNLGIKAYNDQNFNREIKWANLYLDEFDHVFLNGNVTLKIDKNLDALNLDFELSKYKPDLVIQYGRIYRFNKRLRNWCAQNNVKNAYVSDSENRHSENIIKRIAKKLVLTSYFKNIDYFFTVGDANEEYYQTYGVSRKKMFRMNFSIDIKHFETNFSNKEFLRNEFRNRLKIEQDDLVLSVVGKLVSWKNQSDIVQLVLNLEKDHNWPKVHLIIAGSGPCEAQLKDQSLGLINKKIHFLGFVDPIDLPKVYAASDIYIHPSEFEPHSLAVSEAIYMGLPVIVSYTTGSYGPTDDVRIGQNGYVFQTGNILDLKSKIILLKDENTRYLFGKKSREIGFQNQSNAHFEFLNLLYHEFV